MTATVNGWRVLTRAECAEIDVPGGQLPVHQKLAVIFHDLATQYHARVEHLVWPGCWGWAAPRPVRGKSGGKPTNHASGTAIDLCAPQHPQGVATSITFTQGEIAVCHELVARYDGVIVWGGDWTGSDVDGMHWEVAPGTTVEAVDALTAKLAGGGVPAPAPAAVPAPAPAPAPAATSGWVGPDLTGSGITIRGDVGNNGPRVAGLQDGLRTKYPLYAKGLAVDGWWGPDTTAALAQFAARSGVRGADGRNIGPQIARKLYLAGIRP